MHTETKIFLASIAFITACLALIAQTSHKAAPIVGETYTAEEPTVWICGKYCLAETRDDLADSDEMLAAWDGTSQYANPY